MDQNRDGFIDKNDLRDTFAALGKPTFISQSRLSSIIEYMHFIHQLDRFHIPHLVTDEKAEVYMLR